MGTLDTRGGSPISPNEPDFAPSKLVEDVLALLEVSGAPTAVSDKVVALIKAAEALASSPSQPALDWQEEARRYSRNADYWRARAEKAEAELHGEEK